MLDYDDLLLYWGELMRVPELAAEVGARFDHVLVDEYQDTNALQAAILRGLKPDGAGLTVVGDDAQAIYGFRAATVRNILDFPGQFDPPADDRAAGAELPLDPADPRRLQRRHRPRPRAVHQEPALVTGARASGRRWSRSPDDIGQVELHRRGRAGEPRVRHGAQGAGRAVPHLAPQRHARDRAHAPQHPVRQVRRAQVHRSRARQGHAGGAALGREPGRPRHRLPRRAAAAGHRPRHRRQGARPHGRAFARSMRWRRSARPPRRPMPGAIWSR